MWRSPLLNSILVSNRLQVERALDASWRRGKAGGAARLELQGGYRRSAREPDRDPRRGADWQGLELRIYDKNVSIARLFGANKDYINKQIPHLSSLLTESIDELLRTSEVIVVGNAAPEFGDALKRTRPDQIILDLVRVKTERSQIPGDYREICWYRGITAGSLLVIDP